MKITLDKKKIFRQFKRPAVVVEFEPGDKVETFTIGSGVVVVVKGRDDKQLVWNYDGLTLKGDEDELE